jgi:hypothetical protein
VPEAWDTTTAARLRPDSQALEYATSRRRDGEGIAFTASTLNEISYGLHKAFLGGSNAAGKHLQWRSSSADSGTAEHTRPDRAATAHPSASAVLLT